jgi:hypothetical protein
MDNTAGYLNDLPPSYEEHITQAVLGGGTMEVQAMAGSSSELERVGHNRMLERRPPNIGWPTLDLACVGRRGIKSALGIVKCRIEFILPLLPNISCLIACSKMTPEVSLQAPTNAGKGFAFFYFNTVDLLYHNKYSVLYCYTYKYCRLNYNLQPMKI